MNTEKIVALSQSYNFMAKQIQLMCQGEEERTVAVKVFYHLPDHPHILHEFASQFDDHFVTGDDVQSEFDKLSKSFMYAASQGAEDMIKDTLLFMQKTLAKAQRHVDRLRATPGEFEIPFHQHPAAKHPEIVQAVPLGRTRKFLSHWLTDIDGPLHSVIIGQAAPSERRLVF